ncbi:hypothetical protein [Streptosporangium saharense]|uniref:hypothetical protein n=1 Tax=Streptosporangium saharense TaxID=1706840 RepID=UPI00342184E8
MSSEELVILFGISYRPIAALLMGFGLIVLSLGVISTLILVLFTLCRRLLDLRRGSRSGNSHERNSFVLEWMK